MPAQAVAARSLLTQRTRQTLLTAHIMMSVALLGDSAGFLAVAMRLSATSCSVARTTLLEILRMFSLMFGIPLSIGTIVTGIALGVGTKWGVFRYPWVVAKLLLIASVMLVGGVVIGPAEDAMLDGRGDATTPPILAAAYDVVALAVATGLGVFKPGRAFGIPRKGGPAAPAARVA